MKIKRSNLAVSALVSIMAFSFMTNSPSVLAAEHDTSFKEVKKESQELLQSLKSYSANQKDEAVQATKKALDKIDARIERLEEDVRENWNAMDKATQEQTQKSLRALHRQRNKVAEWYGSLKNSSAESWNHIKQGFSDAYQSVNDAWEKSVEAFQSAD